MGRCAACGKQMRYSEFEQHLQENPKCYEKVKKLREEGEGRELTPEEFQELL